VVTELGAAFYQHCRAMVIEAEEAEHLVRSRQSEPVGRVRFSCPVALGQQVVANLLPRFMDDHPKVTLVERLTNATVDLVEDGFDLALRMHANPLETPGLVHRQICPVQLILVGSPGYLKTPGDLAEPDSLQDANALPQWHAGEAMLSMFTPPRRGTLPAVRAFADYLLKELPPTVAAKP
jgi:DNA-binding transcriptional LysR family regulator